MITTVKTDWQAVIREIGPELAARAGTVDRSGDFVAENYRTLKSVQAMSAAVPTELGGGGLSHRGLCEMIRELAHHCPSTSLALSMHSHLVAATVWKHRRGQGGEPLLRRVVQEQLVLLSTGGTDWVDSNGAMERVDGGYLVSGRKVFGSGSPAADIMITSSRYEHPHEGWQVLHFPLSMRAEGVRVLDDWDSLGMRGTGSNTVLLERAFVSDDAIALTRPAGQWHPVWSMVVTVALPIFLASYVGIAEKARDLAVIASRKRLAAGDPHLPQLVGEMENQLMSARLAWWDMVRTANDYDFDNSVQVANRTLIQRSLLGRACIATVQKAMEVAGGRSYSRSFGMEQLLRDVMAVTHHPLTEKRQEVFSGRIALGLDPITAEPVRAPRSA